MSMIKKFTLISALVSIVVYIGMSIWLYLQEKADKTGWASIGIVAFVVLIVFPVVAIVGGIVGALITKKVWLFPVINTIATTIFIASVFILMENVKLAIIILVPVVFIGTIIVSGITLGLYKLIKTK